MQQSLDSRVSAETHPFLNSWDTRARKYAQFFQVYTLSGRNDLTKLRSSALTTWKDVIQRQDRYQALDSLKLRQQLGEITPEECSEVNRVMGGNPVSGYTITRSRHEPALLHAWNNFEFLAFAGAGGALGAYGRFVKGYNNLWLAAAALPLMTLGLVQSARQPTTMIDNAYR